MDMDIGFASFQFEKLTNNNFVTPLNSHEIAPGEDSDIESNEYPEPRSDSVINNYTVVEQINQVYSENNYVQNINDPNAAANLLHESSQATTLSTYNINQWSVLSLDTQPIIQPIQLNKVNEEINFLPFDAPGQTNNQATPRAASSEDLYESSSSMRYHFDVECIKEKIAAMWAKTQSLDDHLDENDFTILKTSLQLGNETITTALSKKLDELMVVKRRTYELNQQQRAKTRINPFDLELTPEQKEAVLKLPTLINKNKAVAKRRNEPTERDKKAGLRILPDITDIDFVDPEDLLIPKKLMKWQDVLSEDIPEGGILNRLEGKQ
ncbi:uncharacterized protein [Atheta coriaria]|uniref:uncharacterized protein n=1 Tax=Dalotia coriaria TaxID=877792 RepID=UPI0031F348EE